MSVQLLTLLVALSIASSLARFGASTPPPSHSNWSQSNGIVTNIVTTNSTSTANVNVYVNNTLVNNITIVNASTQHIVNLSAPVYNTTIRCEWTLHYANDSDEVLVTSISYVTVNVSNSLINNNNNNVSNSVSQSQNQTQGQQQGLTMYNNIFLEYGNSLGQALTTVDWYIWVIIGLVIFVCSIIFTQGKDYKIHVLPVRESAPRNPYTYTAGTGLL